MGAIGFGTMIAGYLCPNTGEKLTDAVQEFEKRWRPVTWASTMKSY